MIYFALREGWRNFRHLGIIGLLTLTSLSLTLILIGISVRGYMVLDAWSSGLLGRFEIEAFLSQGMDSTAAMDLAVEIQLIPKVGAVRYVSQDEAARRFESQFGSEILDLLDYNPLPSSLVVTLSRDADPAESWSIVAERIGKMAGVSDVAYQGELLAKVNFLYVRAGRMALIAVGFMLAVALTFTVLAVHGSIRARERFIRVLLLCGGSRVMARGPFVALGGYYGLISSAGGIAVVMGIGELIDFAWQLHFRFPHWWIPMLVGVGLLIGMGGAGWAAGGRIKDV